MEDEGWFGRFEDCPGDEDCEEDDEEEDYDSPEDFSDAFVFVSFVVVAFLYRHGFEVEKVVVLEKIRFEVVLEKIRFEVFICERSEKWWERVGIIRRRWVGRLSLSRWYSLLINNSEDDVFEKM